MLSRSLPAALLVALASLSCAQAPTTPSFRQRLDELGSGAFVAGSPVGLGPPTILNRRDFVYALAFSRASSDIAFVHHVTKSIEVSVSNVESRTPRFQQALNAAEHDVEDVLFLDAQRLVAPSRQGTARRIDAKSGALLDELVLGEALTRVAASPAGDLLAFGTASGGVILVDGATFAFRGAAAPHTDEVQGLAFLDARTLASVSFDGALVVSEIVDAPRDVVRAPTGALASGARVFVAHLEGRRGISTVRDARGPENVVTTAAVKRLGLAPAGNVDVTTPLGAQQVPAVQLGDVHVRGLRLAALTAGVCDACVPSGAELVLGGDVLAEAGFVDDVARDEVVARPLGAGAAFIDGLLATREVRRTQLPGPGTDLDVTAGAHKAIVAYSHARAVRSFEVNDAEKHDRWPAVSDASGAVLVDLRTGALGAKLVGHQGFTVTASIAPDGATAATGGWDHRVLVWNTATGELVTERSMAWLVRRVRFSPDGTRLAVAAWTPANVNGDGASEPALNVYPVERESPQVVVR